MTTTIKVMAHPGTNREVLVRIFDAHESKPAERRVLQEGESVDFYIYDSRSIEIVEREKACVGPMSFRSHCYDGQRCGAPTTGCMEHCQRDPTAPKPKITGPYNPPKPPIDFFA